MVLCLQLPLVATLETGKQRTGAESSHGKLVLDAASDGSLRQVATLPLGWDVICDYSSVKDLDPIIGEGTAVQKLVDYAEENNTVPRS